MFENELLILNLVSTLFMTGVIWFVQIIHYPLFKFIPEESFPNFSVLHSTNAGYIVIVPMVTELITSILLLKWHPNGLPYYYFLTGFILVLIIWFSTFLLQVPIHDSLSKGYDERRVDMLVKTNWLRTTAWSLRAMLITFIIYGYLK